MYNVYVCTHTTHVPPFLVYKVEVYMLVCTSKQHCEWDLTSIAIPLYTTYFWSPGILVCVFNKGAWLVMAGCYSGTGPHTVRRYTINSNCWIFVSSLRGWSKSPSQGFHHTHQGARPNIVLLTTIAMIFVAPVIRLAAIREVPFWQLPTWRLYHQQ